MADPQSQPEPAAEGTAPPDPRDLVRRMAEAGEWPEPALLEQIAAAGESAVEPLLELLRSRPRGWPDEALLANAMGMLETLGARSAIPELAAVAREYLNETAQDAAGTLARLGDEGFDTLLSVIQDPGVAGYHRCHLIDAAIQNALADPDRRRRLADALRSLFDRALRAAREARSFENELLEAAAAASSDAEDATFDEIEEIAEDELDETDREEEPTEEPRSGQEGPAWEDLAENEVPPDVELGFLAADLCRLADPLARELLLSAFDEGLIDASVIDRKGVETSYRTAPEPPDPAIPWLDDYRESYRVIRENQRRVASMGEVTFPSRTSYPSFDREDPQAGLPSPPLQTVEPIRHEGPRIGRNDPCWCGSGKKYKKCHWGKDG